MEGGELTRIYPEKMRLPLLSKSRDAFMGFTSIGVTTSESTTLFGTVSIIRCNSPTQVLRKPVPCSPRAIIVRLLSLS